MRLRRLNQLLGAAITVATVHVSRAADDLTPLSEEFDSASAHLNFQRLYQTEGWPANQLQTFFTQTTEGRLVMIPYPSSWYQDYKGPLVYKSVTGDFVATVQVQVRNGAENGSPTNPFSFGGLLVRAPRSGVTSPGTWQAGHEDWIIQAAGTAGTGGVANYEFKSTDNSVTQPNFPAGTDHAVFQIARVGNVFILLRQPVGGSWSVVQRYHRADMPTTMQVGLTAYANFNVASAVTPLVHNQTVLSGSADLVARFDYYRLQRPVIPQNLQGADFMQVSDAQLLAIFADNANPAPVALSAPVVTGHPQSQAVTAGDDATFSVTATGNPAPTFQWRRDGVNIIGATTATYTLNNASTNDSGAVFSVLVSNSEGSVSSTGATLTVNPPAADDIAHLSDEFDTPSTRANWQRVFQVEGWGFDQLEQWDINQSHPGRMTMTPYTSSWFQEWRGVQAYKQVTGDFVVTTDVEPTGRSGSGPPNRQYSLSGIMVRTPRNNITNGRADWTPNGENYIFLSMGAASQPGTAQFEVKTTINSSSNLEITPGGSRARIQIARIGSAFIVLRQIDNNPWEVHRRYHRADMPQTLNVGLTTYTDWSTCQQVGYEYHNTNRLDGTHPRLAGGSVTASPDLIARFDYVRYRRPQVPAGLAGSNLADPAQVSDAQLLAFLAGNANLPASTNTSVAPTITTQPASMVSSAGSNLQLTVVANGTAPLSYQWSHNGQPIQAATQSTLLLNALIRASSGNYTVSVSNTAGTVTSQSALLRVLVPQRILAPIRQPNGQYRIMFGDHDGGPLTAAEAANFEIWATSNLRTGWTQLTTPVAADGTMLYLDDDQSVGQPQRFYRILER